MDLREKKTRASIRRAYLELRAEKGAGRITVRELADRAQVGKATFYLHYRSIYDLSEALQREAIGMIVAGIEEPAALLTAPDRASWQLFSSFEKHRELIDVLFRGEQAAVLCRMHKCLLLVDAAQTAGVLPLYPEEWGVDQKGERAGVPLSGPAERTGAGFR